MAAASSVDAVLAALDADAPCAEDTADMMLSATEQSCQSQGMVISNENKVS